MEEQLQIDLSSPTTAPGLYRLSKKLCNGTPCKNITVKNCTIQGARGICANFAGAGNEAKYRKARNYHSNITIENCNVTGISAEAIALFQYKKCHSKEFAASQPKHQKAATPILSAWLLPTKKAPLQKQLLKLKMLSALQIIL